MARTTAAASAVRVGAGSLTTMDFPLSLAADSAVVTGDAGPVAPDNRPGPLPAVSGYPLLTVPSGLADNGVPTRSLALLTGSPAIDHGNVVRPVTFDQRFFKRVVGASPDIGATEFVDSIFADTFDPGEVIGRD